MDREPSRGALLAPDEPPAVEEIAGSAAADTLFICDHASNRLPRALEGLGLAPPEIARHIAWDIGAAAVTRALAAAFGAPAVLAAYSRLVVDPNRSLDEKSLIPEAADGTEIPLNRDLSSEGRAARIAAFYQPYHHAVDRALGAMAARERVPALIAIHSFTPALKGEGPRPWQVGVLWNRDPRLAEALLAALRREGDLTVGDNEPYSGFDGLTHTTDVHALAKGYPHVEIELRQDLIETAHGAAAWAARLARVLGPLLRDPAHRRICHY